eukprot:4715867-Amphidinium_carterae.1
MDNAQREIMPNSRPNFEKQRNRHTILIDVLQELGGGFDVCARVSTQCHNEEEEQPLLEGTKKAADLIILLPWGEATEGKTVSADDILEALGAR